METVVLLHGWPISKQASVPVGFALPVAQPSGRHVPCLLFFVVRCLLLCLFPHLLGLHVGLPALSDWPNDE